MREYNLKYLGRIGNVLHTNDIEAAIGKRNRYNPDPEPCTDSQEYLDNFYSSTIMKEMGIDADCGSVPFERVNGN
ncbi:MAG TPA: hypothetical protein VFI73_12275 [Candidatus Nitrosopolaris sp.]|nr:hypothetical protein [Candidatus Nitrosopolaris sp.]